MKYFEDVRQPIDIVDIYLQDENFREWLKHYLYITDWHHGWDEQAILSLVNVVEPDFYIEFILTCYRCYSRASFH